MIQLIPDYISNDVKSDAEKKLFQEFKEGSTSDKFIVLHSLAMAEHVNNIFGEIDFVIIQDDKLNPIEVKSGQYKKHTSIDRFKTKFNKKVGTRYVLHTKDLKIEGDIVYLPFYMAMFF